MDADSTAQLQIQRAAFTFRSLLTLKSELGIGTSLHVRSLYRPLVESQRPRVPIRHIRRYHATNQPHTTKPPPSNGWPKPYRDFQILPASPIPSNGRPQQTNSLGASDAIGPSLRIVRTTARTVGCNKLRSQPMEIGTRPLKCNTKDCMGPTTHQTNESH